VVYGDLDGDGVEDIVLSAAAAGVPTGAVIPQGYLDVFLDDGHGGWSHDWSATGPVPPGDPSAPASVLTKARPREVSQEVDTLAVLDLAGDRSGDLLIGVLNLGAGTGPLDAWVIGFGPQGPTTEFWEATVSGGVLIGAGDTVKLDAPDFAPSDPACCPSRISHQTIGYDPATGKVRVLRQTFTPVG
jgi:hypothetical protein